MGMEWEKKMGTETTNGKYLMKVVMSIYKLDFSA